MSNQLVGNIYQRIIAEVIESSQVDFEEGGVDPSTLDELKQVWQRKLSSLQVAHFPWDPNPATIVAANPPPVPSNAPSVKASPAPPLSNPLPATATALSSNAAGPRIKTEPGTEGGPQSLSNPQVAAQRAANLVQQKFGNQAQNSIGAIQSGIPPPVPRPATSAQLSPNPQVSPPLPGSAQSNQPANGVVGAQTDGAGEADKGWTAVMGRRTTQGGDELIARVEVDDLLRRHIMERGLQMEGGGLMLPLSERPILAKKSRGISSAIPGLETHPTSSAQRTQNDGGNDSDDSDEDDKDRLNLDDLNKTEEVDEDAINSDLDDPDENAPEDQEDDDMTQIMLCMYDKVQRVKNKW
ncbi:MAG: transcription factor IIA subunit alpha, partial [Thelocarpon superellum]